MKRLAELDDEQGCKVANLVEQAQRLVKAKGFAWVQGMLYGVTYDGPGYDPNAISLTARFTKDPYTHPDKPHLPDLSDPATVGCLLWLYDQTRTMLTVPDPVYTLVAAYGLMHEKTLDEIIKRLEG